MSRYHSYIKSASSIIGTYKADQPFAIAIKKFFSANKQMGSRDRKAISSICYAYFRVKHLFTGSLGEEQFIQAIFLCHQDSLPMLADLNPALDAMIHLPVEQKLNHLGYQLQDIFPFEVHLSEAIKQDEFYFSFLTQPLLYLRIRPGKENIVKEKLESAGIAFQYIHPQCVALSNALPIDSILKIDKEAVVQDMNSQQVFNSINTIDAELLLERKIVWDACAASGGKSILWYDKISNNIDLAVSDVRKTSLANLAERFKTAGILQYETFVADLTKTAMPGKKYDVVICDAPCTGSGTWSRTPEQLAYFKPTLIKEYQSKQKAIAANAAVSLNEDGYFFYITCSVFHAENETVVAHLQEYSGLELLHQQYLEGYDKKADTLFVAVFRK
jgi:16S rRNA (cytosine967-C5)-methyltransferase